MLGRKLQLVLVDLDLPLFWKSQPCNSRPSMCDFVPCDQIVQMAYSWDILSLVLMFPGKGFSTRIWGLMYTYKYRRLLYKVSIGKLRCNSRVFCVHKAIDIYIFYHVSFYLQLMWCFKGFYQLNKCSCRCTQQCSLITCSPFVALPITWLNTSLGKKTELSSASRIPTCIPWKVDMLTSRMRDTWREWIMALC